MAKKNNEEQFFKFAETVKKTKIDNHLECHNHLCEAKRNCKYYYGKKDGEFIVNRESCRIYAPKGESNGRSAYKHR